MQSGDTDFHAVGEGGCCGDNGISETDGDQKEDVTPKMTFQVAGGQGKDTERGHPTTPEPQPGQAEPEGP